MKKLFAVSMITASAGLLLGGCASKHPKESKSTYSKSTYVNESSGAERPESMQQQSAESAAKSQWVIPIYQEQLNVGKQSVDGGQVTIRKTVTTQTVSQPVQLQKDTLTIDREAAGAAGSSPSESSAGAPFEEKTYTIQLKEEQPVIQKTTVMTGQVVAHKNSTTQQQDVSQQLRREDVKIDKGANAGNVTINGNFDNANEPAGAAKDKDDSKDKSKEHQQEQQQQQ